jgi:hypothetical protein
MAQQIVIFGSNPEKLQAFVDAIQEQLGIREVATQFGVQPNEIYLDGANDYRFQHEVESLSPSIGVDVPEVTPTGDEEFFDEEAHEIVQIRVPDFVYDEESPTMTAWADTNIHPLDIKPYRERFPQHEYRTVEVTDEIEFVEDSPEGTESISAEDELGMLKAEVLKLQAEVANLKGGYTSESNI